MISEEIRKEFAQSILISDVNAYFDTHKSKHEEWLKLRKQEPKNSKPKTKKPREEADYEEDAVHQTKQ